MRFIVNYRLQEMATFRPLLPSAISHA